MKTKNIAAKIGVVSVVLIILVLISLKAGRGGLEQSLAVEPTTNNLDETYNLAALTDTQVPQPLAFDAFLKIDGISGESTDDKHKDWIEVLSYAHGIASTASGASTSGGGRTAERVQFEDFSITKRLDKSTPKLALYCCKGQHIKEVTLELCRTQDNQPFMKYKLSDVIVTVASPSGGVISSQTLPIEEVGFSFGKIEWTYTEFDRLTSKAKGDVKAYWDVTTNKGG